MEKKFVGIDFEKNSRIENITFEGCDFSKTNFNGAHLYNVKFIRCLFFRTIFDDVKNYENGYFEDCHFESVKFHGTNVISNKVLLNNCIFKKCNIKIPLFSSIFKGCQFLDMKIKGVRFNDSTFENCKFTGTLEDISFNGIYDSNPDPKACLKNVDFSNCFFKEFVSFENCDLSTSLPPNGHTFEKLLYKIYTDVDNIYSTGSKDKMTLNRSRAMGL
ncbi:pentapeptide repeat-containing protein [Myroides sp. LJL116]